MRETEGQMEEAKRLSCDLAQLMFSEGFQAHRYPLTERPGAGVIVWLPPVNVCKIFVFKKGGRWWWYRVIDGGRIHGRDHLLALSRVSATAMAWARNHGAKWSDTDLYGQDVRPLAEVQ